MEQPVKVVHLSTILNAYNVHLPNVLPVSPRLLCLSVAVFAMQLKIFIGNQEHQLVFLALLQLLNVTNVMLN